MQFMKRIFLVVAANLLVMLALGIVFTVLVAFVPALRGSGYGPLIVLSAVFGFGGAIVSWAFSKQFAKWLGGLQVIDPARAVGAERELLQMVYRLAERAGIRDMPEVAVWASPEINAYCTGPSKNSTLVAVSTGLLQRMDRDELEGVLAHEIGHSANGDMATLALVNGVVNTVVLLISFVVTNIIASQMRRDDGRGGGMMDYFFRHMIFSLVQGLVGLFAAMMIVLPFSRWREFRADAEGARMVGKTKVIAALEALKDNFRLPRQAVAAAEAASDPSMASMKISSLKASALFSTHPSLDERIERLRGM